MQIKCSIILTVLIAAVISGCGGVEFLSQSKDESSKTCVSGEPCQVPCAGSACPTSDGPFNTYNKTVDEDVTAVDVLFVVDNSASMKAELQNLGSKFHEFANSLQYKDWQACLITTNYESEKGALREWAPGVFVLNKSVAGFASVFATALNSIDEGDLASNIEQGIRSANAAVSRAGLASSHGCFRANAAKAVVFVSDEDELAEGWVRGIGKPYDPVADNYPASLLNRVKSTFGANVRFTAHAIAVQPGAAGAACQAAQNLAAGNNLSAYPAVRYGELVTATSGEFASICAPDFSQPLIRIGERILSSLSSIELPCPGDAEVKQVKIESAVVGTHGFKVEGSRVTFQPALNSGDSVTVEYRCK